jgi:hypothetical protein
LAAVSAVAAVSVGAGATLAQAAELKAQDTTSLRAGAAGTATDVQARGAVGGAAKALFNLLKKHGGKIYSGAVKAAKGNWGKFRSYMDGLPWYHPVRIAWVAAGAEAQYQLYTYIRSLV